MKENTIKKTFLLKDIAILIAVFAAGAACIPLGEGWAGLGITILLCAAIMVPFCRHGYRLEGHKGIFQLKELPLSREGKTAILAYLDGSADNVDLHGCQPGGALVDIYYRKGDDLRFARYFDYADFLQGVDYPLYEVTEQQVSKLESFATNKK